MFDELVDSALEAELCAQASHVSAGECRLVLLIGEFDRREAWGGVGIRSCAHWLNWRVGTSLGAAREQVRVGRALVTLPLVRSAFAAGQLSYSKVRAITRVATAEIERDLVELARHATASQLEQIVRAYRQADPDEGRKALDRHDRRYLRFYTDDEGMLVVTGRFAPEDGAVVLAAIEAAVAGLSEPESATEDVSAETSVGPRPPRPDFEQSAADALVAACAAALSSLDETPDGPPLGVIVHVDEKVLEDPSAPGCADVQGIGAIAAHTAARLACDGAVSRVLFRHDGIVEQQGSTRSIPRAMRRALHTRDGGCCRFPGCNNRRFLHAHHVVYFSRGGRTKLSNLVLLCSFHHRLVHEGGWQLVLEPSGKLTVTAPDGAPQPAAGALGPAIGPSLVEQHLHAGLDIDDTTLDFGGGSYDLAGKIN